MLGKNARLSKKMQNILLLNSENSIPVCTPVEFQTVLGPSRDPDRGAREGGGAGGHQILYNYRKGAIRVAGEKSEQKMNLMHWIFKIFYWKRPWVSTTSDGWRFFTLFKIFL